MDLRREIALLLLGSICGAGVSLAFGVFDSPQQRSSWVLPTVIVVLAVMLIIRSLGPLRYLVASPGGFRLNGQWSGYFEYEKDGAVVRIEERLSIRQTGRHVKGQSISTAIIGDFPLPHAMYRIDAVLRPDAIIEGTWKNEQVEHRYHGNLLGRVSRSGDRIDGNWIGVEDPTMRWGKFAWSRSA